MESVVVLFIPTLSVLTWALLSYVVVTGHWEARC